MGLKDRWRSLSPPGRRWAVVFLLATTFFVGLYGLGTASFFLPRTDVAASVTQTQSSGGAPDSGTPTPTGQAGQLGTPRAVPTLPPTPTQDFLPPPVTVTSMPVRIPTTAPPRPLPTAPGKATTPATKPTAGSGATPGTTPGAPTSTPGSGSTPSATGTTPSSTPTSPSGGPTPASGTTPQATAASN